MDSRSYEGIISKVAADVSLNDLATDTVARDKILILALAGVITKASRHCVHGSSRVKIQIQGKWPQKK